MTMAAIVRTGEKSTRLLFHNVARKVFYQIVEADQIYSTETLATVSDKLITESMSIFIDTATDTASDTSGV